MGGQTPQCLTIPLQAAVPHGFMRADVVAPHRERDGTGCLGALAVLYMSPRGRRFVPSHAKI